MTPPRRQVKAAALYDPALEEAALDGMLHYPTVCALALDKLAPTDFGSEDARRLFDIISKLGEGDWSRVAHAAKQSGWENVLPYIAHIVGSGTDNPKLINDMLALRRRRSLEDVSDLAREASKADDPEQAMSLVRALVAEEPSANGYHRMSAADLLEADYPDPVWVVQDWLSEGLCMFGGRPKARKSFLMLQLCIAKAVGGSWLGQRLRPGPVIYYALEDGKRRLAKRLRALECPRGVGTLNFQETLPPVDKGAVEHITEAVDETGAELVVIDTLEAAMVGAQRGKDQDVNAYLTAKLRPFQRLALDRHIAVVFVDHLRKPGLSKRSLINDVMGGTAKVAVADTIWGLWREDGETRGEFQMKGRDVEELSHLLEFRPTPLAWQYIGDLEEATMSESERRYVDTVRELGPDVDSRAVAEYQSVTPQAAQDMLRKLRESGRLTHEIKTTPKGGRTFLYSVPSRSALVPPTEGVSESPLDTEVGSLGSPPALNASWDGEWWQEH